MERGPFRKVLRSEKAGRRGTTRWLIELECGHVHNLLRKPSKERMCCDQCLPQPEDDYVLDLSEDFTKVRLAATFGVDTDQIVMFEGGCQITLDTLQIRKLQIDGL